MTIACFLLLVACLAIFGEYQSQLGYQVHKFGMYVFGAYYQWIFTPMILALGVMMLIKKDFWLPFSRILGIIVYFVTLCTLVWFATDYPAGLNIHVIFEDTLGKGTSILLLLMLLLLSLYLVFHINSFQIAKKVVALAPDRETMEEKVKGIFARSEDEEEDEEEPKKSSKKTREIVFKKPQKETPQPVDEKQTQLPLEKTVSAVTHIPIVKKEKKSFIDQVKNPFSKAKDTEEKKEVHQPNYSDWELPSLDLLADFEIDTTIDTAAVEEKQEKIIEKLAQFKIDVQITDYKIGPTVIQFRLKPEEGVKLNRIENLKKDLTLALHAKSIRIQAPIPGEWVVGIEVPNENRQMVRLKEVILATSFASRKIDIPLAVGKDVNGDIVVGDLTKMPHLMVAGQTASGKSVGMNGFIVSMLYKFSPSELKMILIDPKMVELSIYNGIPHLLTPVITNPDKALNSLKWAVAEMLRRYDLARQKNARNFHEFNAKAKKDEKMPYIVIVIDELADLMMSGNKKEVESSIARLAQMARAVGMHLIIATQRPSVDVITGLIKANIPSRIAFTVASQIDSRTVLDKAGAEDLLWKWDMLYFPTGTAGPQRVQGVFIETEEVERIVNQIKLTVDPDLLDNLYDTSIADGRSTREGSILEGYEGDQEEDPEIIEKAIALVRESRKWSTSLIQRKLGLGYARAAKVLDILEELGIVWPANGSKPREVYD